MSPHRIAIGGVVAALALFSALPGPPADAGAIPSVPLNLALLKGCAILGVFWGEFTERQPAAYEDSIRRLGEWYRAGQLRPHISLRLPLKDAALALRRMKERRVTGKAVLTVGSA